MKRQITAKELYQAKNAALVEIIKTTTKREKISTLFRINSSQMYIFNNEYKLTFQDLELYEDFYDIEIYYDSENIMLLEDELYEDKNRFEDIF